MLQPLHSQWQRALTHCATPLRHLAQPKRTKKSTAGLPVMYVTFPHRNKPAQEDRFTHLLHDPPTKKALKATYTPAAPCRCACVRACVAWLFKGTAAACGIRPLVALRLTRYTLCRARSMYAEQPWPGPPMYKTTKVDPKTFTVPHKVRQALACTRALPWVPGTCFGRGSIFAMRCKCLLPCRALTTTCPFPRAS